MKPPKYLLIVVFSLIITFSLNSFAKSDIAIVNIITKKGESAEFIEIVNELVDDFNRSGLEISGPRDVIKSGKADLLKKESLEDFTKLGKILNVEKVVSVNFAQSQKAIYYNLTLYSLQAKKAVKNKRGKFQGNLKTKRQNFIEHLKTDIQNFANLKPGEILNPMEATGFMPIDLNDEKNFNQVKDVSFAPLAVDEETGENKKVENNSGAKKKAEAIAFTPMDVEEESSAKKKEKEIRIYKVAALEIKSMNTDKNLTNSMSQILATRLGEFENLKVISKEEMKAMIGFEFEKKSMGCSDDISCLAEIGGALGVDFIVSGTLGRIKKMYILNMMMINIKKASVKNRISVTWKGKDEKLIELVSPYTKILIEGKMAENYRGDLQVEVDKKGATVTVDSLAVGKTPLKREISLKIGKHALKVTYPGLERFEEDIIIQ